MNLNKRKLRDLRLKRKEKYIQTLDFIINDDIKNTKKNIEWIELSKKFSELQKSKFKPALFIGLIGILFLIIGLLPIRSTLVKIKLETNYINLTLAENLVSGLSLNGSEVNIRALSNIEWEFQNWKNNKLLEETIVSISGIDPVKLKIKEFHKSAIITFDKSIKNYLNLSVDNDSILTEIQIKKGHLEIGSLGIDTTINTNFQSVIILERNNLAIPTQFVVKEIDTLENINMIAERINYDKQLRSGVFESGILGGNILISATGINQQLYKGSVLDMDFIGSIPLSINVLRDRMIIEFEAEVKRIKAGPKKLTKSLMPTILDYFQKNEKTAFYGTTIIWLWGMLWSIKKTTFD